MYEVNAERYGETEAKWLEQQLEAFWSTHEFDNVDCDRLARKGVREEEEAYEEIQNAGCCGSEDVEFGPSPAGHTYLYGFNHDH